MTSVFSIDEVIKKKYWQGLHTISSHEVDFNNNLSLHMLFGLFQEAAYQHVKVLNIGWKDLYSENMGWILSRIKIKIENLPCWEDDITIKTWSTGTDGIKANRSWLVKNTDNKTIIQATSNWLIMNETTRRIVRIDKNKINPHSLNNYVMDSELEKLHEMHEHDTLFEITAKNSEMDVNHHVNNTNYIKWVFDAEKIEFLKDFYPSEIEINYLKEALPGNKIEVRKDLQKNGYNQYSIFNGESDSARIKILWNKIKY